MILWKLLSIAGGLAFLGLAYWTISPAFRSDGSETSGTDASPLVTPVGTAGPTDPVLVGAGDIASCAQENDEKTAALLDQVVATASQDGAESVVFTAGDNAYESGTLEEYEQCYGPTWGRHKDRTRPATGNHEYAIGQRGRPLPVLRGSSRQSGAGYYSFDLGTWHVIVLDTGDHCQIVACAVGSAAGTMAPRGPGRQPGLLHRRDLARSALHVRRKHKQRALSTPSLASAL